MNKPRKKILFIHQVGVSGGAGTMLCNIIQAIDKSIFDPIVICPAGDITILLEAAGASVLINTIPIIQFPHTTGHSRFPLSPLLFNSLYKIWKYRISWANIFKEIRADIVCFNAITLAPMIWSAKRANIKSLCIVQETVVNGLFGLRAKWLYSILNKMDAVIFISKYDLSMSKCKASLVEVIPNWVEPLNFGNFLDQNKSKKLLNIPTENKVILMMGGISKIKGTLPLLMAISKLNNLENITVLIAGYCKPVNFQSLNLFHKFTHLVRKILNLDYINMTYNYINKNNLKNNIMFTGMYSDVSVLYSAADFLVFPSTRPHQSRPVLEAGFLSKPVIAPNFKAINEFIINDLNGLTYPEGNINELSRCIQILLNSPELVRCLGDNNFIKTSELHSNITAKVKLNNLLNQLLIS